MFKSFLIVAMWSAFSMTSEASSLAIEKFNQTILITVFNVQKTQNGSWSDEVFKALVEGSDLVLVQESIDRFPNYKYEGSYYIDYFYKSWGNITYNTGLTSLTRVPFDEAMRLVSVDTEPIAATPKVTSVEKYSVFGLEHKLLVANTHAINFTGFSAFKRQISAVAKRLSEHEGPIVWAGDFNTWSSRRKKYLDEVMLSLGLKEVIFEKRSESFLVLDHVYVRGAKVRYAEQLQVGISDHEPLKFSLEFQEESSL